MKDSTSDIPNRKKRKVVIKGAGMVPTSDEIINEILSICKKVRTILEEQHKVWKKMRRVVNRYLQTKKTAV